MLGPRGSGIGGATTGWAGADTPVVMARLLTVPASIAMIRLWGGFTAGPR